MDERQKRTRNHGMVLSSSRAEKTEWKQNTCAIFNFPACFMRSIFFACTLKFTECDVLTAYIHVQYNVLRWDGMWQVKDWGGNIHCEYSNGIMCVRDIDVRTFVAICDSRWFPFPVFRFGLTFRTHATRIRRHCQASFATLCHFHA